VAYFFLYFMLNFKRSTFTKLITWIKKNGWSTLHTVLLFVAWNKLQCTSTDGRQLISYSNVTITGSRRYKPAGQLRHWANCSQIKKGKKLLMHCEINHPVLNWSHSLDSTLDNHHYILIHECFLDQSRRTSRNHAQVPFLYFCVNTSCT
jgi:hypothetical protein